MRRFSLQPAFCVLCIAHIRVVVFCMLLALAVRALRRGRFVRFSVLRFKAELRGCRPRFETLRLRSGRPAKVSCGEWLLVAASGGQ